MKKVLAVLLTLLLGATVLSACGSTGAGGGATLSGNYVLVEMESEGQVVDQAMLETLGMQDFLNIEFKDDGTATIKAQGETENVNYTLEGSSITITGDGPTISGTVDGNRITLDVEGQKMVVEKK